MKTSDTKLNIGGRFSRLAIQAGGCVGLGLLVAASAAVTKEAVHRSANGLAPLAAIEVPSVEEDAAAQSGADQHTVIPATFETVVESPEVTIEETAIPYSDAEIRYFNGRAVRPAKTIKMTVTAYSPDERSCGGTADGITSSIHSVWTNAMKLVAADSKVLPLGSMISVPGYDRNNIVPVLDRGGAIKGNRLDVLYPTHEQALKWGVQKLEVVVWEHADGKPADDFRAIRDSRN